MTFRHGVPTILAASAAVLMLAACGGSKGEGGTARQSSDARNHAFAECMRKAGLDVEEGTGGNLQMRIGGGISPAKLDKIQRDCVRKTGGGPGSGKQPSKAEQAKFLDQALKFARCMRAHGVDMPDPQADGRGIRIGGPGKRNGIDPKSPAFQAAQKACGRFMPGGKGGPGPSVQSSSGKGGGGPESSLNLQSAP
jgi:hypothetical protein